MSDHIINGVVDFDNWALLSNHIINGDVVLYLVYVFLSKYRITIKPFLRDKSGATRESYMYLDIEVF